jgi:hypothetical protein
MSLSSLVFVTVAFVCAIQGLSYAWQRAGARANLSLASSNVAMTQSSNTEWSLAKTGAVNAL